MTPLVTSYDVRVCSELKKLFRFGNVALDDGRM